MVATHCFCGIHLHTASRIISIKSMMYSVYKFCFLLFQLLYFKSTPEQDEKVKRALVIRTYEWLLGFYDEGLALTFVELTCCVILSIVAVLLFYGNRQHRSGYYWPFILFAIVELCQAIFNLGYFTWRTVELVKGDGADKFAEEERTSAITTCIVLIVLAIIFYTVRTYIFLVLVWQARVYLVVLNNSKITNNHHMPSQVNLRDLDVEKSPGLLKG
ncbi:hypothetical protein M3Y94_00099100 [Aphelenchoides besseyi]|nr:hypothetical protein M3Y94_00099100 [Aphelenchoides besseyi]